MCGLCIESAFASENKISVEATRLEIDGFEHEIDAWFQRCVAKSEKAEPGAARGSGPRSSTIDVRQGSKVIQSGLEINHILWGCTFLGSVHGRSAVRTRQRI